MGRRRRKRSSWRSWTRNGGPRGSQRRYALGWTTDLAGWRAPLTLDSDQERERLTDMFRREADRKGRFGYPAFDQFDVPLLMVGHGGCLGASKLQRWVERLEKNVREDRVRIRLGRFGALPNLPPGTWWVPRQLAVRAPLEGPAEALRPGRVPEHQELDEYARLSSVEVYRVEPSTRPPQAAR